MKKVLICLMVAVFLLGNFSSVFADSRSHRFNKQKHRFGGHSHNKHYKKSHGKAHHSHKSQAVRKHRHQAHKPHVKHKTRHDPRTAVVQKHRNSQHAPQAAVVQKHTHGSVNHKPHFVQNRRHDRRHHRPHFSHRHRHNRHFYRPWYRSNYRSYPKAHFGHRYSYGHRVHVLPHDFISFSLGGLSYYYASGNYYRNYSRYYEVVRPPIGALIPVPPPGYRTVTIDSHEYYLANGVYYVWDNIRKGFRVVPPPEVIHESSEDLPEILESSLKLFVYPNAGQGENEQANDRHDCHLWAVGETNSDPTLNQSSTELERSDYKRALTACLEAREYTVE